MDGSLYGRRIQKCSAFQRREFLEGILPPRAFGLRIGRSLLTQMQSQERTG